MGLPITFAETDTPANTIAFGEMALTNNRIGLDYDTGYHVNDIRRFHPPGVNGQYIVRLGQTSRKIMVRVRYCAATKAAMETLYESDVDNFASKAYNITINGQSYNNCNILEARATSQLRPIGRPDLTNTVFRDYEFTFTRDGGDA